MITLALIALWASIGTGLVLSLLLFPLSRLISIARTTFSKLLFKFLISVAALQVMNIIGPLLLLASYYGWITDPDLFLWLYTLGALFLVIENIVVGLFAFFMYRRLKGPQD
jgi:hypothetical protein